MKKISWIWLLIVSFVFVNASVWLHFIYYEKKYEKIVEEKLADCQKGFYYITDRYSESIGEIILLKKEIKRLEFEKIELPPEPKIEK